jgi:hypothetical protein
MPGGHEKVASVFEYASDELLADMETVKPVVMSLLTSSSILTKPTALSKENAASPIFRIWSIWRRDF